MINCVFPGLETDHAAGANLRIDPRPDRAFFRLFSVKMRHERFSTGGSFSTITDRANVGEACFISGLPWVVIPTENQRELVLRKSRPPRLVKVKIHRLMPTFN